MVRSVSTHPDSSSFGSPLQKYKLGGKRFNHVMAIIVDELYETLRYIAKHNKNLQNIINVYKTVRNSTLHHEILLYTENVYETFFIDRLDRGLNHDGISYFFFFSH